MNKKRRRLVRYKTKYETKTHYRPNGYLHLKILLQLNYRVDRHCNEYFMGLVPNLEP